MSGELESAPRHVPVMLAEVMECLSPEPGDVMVDGTVGCGGHATAIRDALGESGLLIGLDRDPAMAEAARRRLESARGARTETVAGNFSEIDMHLKRTIGRRANGILLDLGFASPQVDAAERGFSYRADGPLDMRMTSDEGVSAEEWINRVPEKELADVLYRCGDERHSRRIARAIVRARQASRIRRTGELAEIIRRAVPGGPRRHHPARRSFQAIRIHVNREMEHLDVFLRKLPDVLAPGGRCVVVSYHSHEDRRVKNAFLEGAREGVYERLTRKPLRPSPEEKAINPRARSAKLRAVRRVTGEAGT